MDMYFVEAVVEWSWSRTRRWKCFCRVVNSCPGTTKDLLYRRAETHYVPVLIVLFTVLTMEIEHESLSGDKNSAHEFKETFLLSVEEEGYSRDDVYNVDETGVNWKALSRKSLTSKRESTAPGFKVSKKRVTAMVCANASGTHSLPLLVIVLTARVSEGKRFSEAVLQVNSAGEKERPAQRSN
ncbi:jerky-like protein [Trichonephila clavipes]|nr:jerky-like protein [Trichonephila clavipes]